jgi:hypothetical protein
LREFGRDKEASDLIKNYVNIRSDEEEVFDFERSLFSRDLKDSELVKTFKEKRQSFRDSRDPVKVLIDITINNGWNPEDIVLISKLTVDNFYKIFKENKGIQLHRIIKAALDFGRIGNASEEMKLISQNTIAALRKIGNESKLNAKRVATQGVILKSDSSL